MQRFIRREVVLILSQKDEVLKMNDKPTKCKKCGATNIRKYGRVIRKGGPRQRYVCWTCGAYTIGDLEV